MKTLNTKKIAPSKKSLRRKNKKSSKLGRLTFSAVSSRLSPGLPSQVTARISERLPIWYNPLAPSGSAIRYIAGCTPRFQYMEVAASRGASKTTKRTMGRVLLTQKLGKHPQKELRVIRNTAIKTIDGKIAGNLHVESSCNNVFRREDEEQLSQLAQELGKLWPSSKKLR